MLGMGLGEGDQDNYDRVLASVKRDGNSLQYATARLKINKVIVKAAVEQNPDAIMYAHNDLRQDPVFFETMVDVSMGKCFRYWVVRNKNIDFKALSWAPNNLQYMPGMWDNVDYVEYALDRSLSSDDDPFRWASPRLKDDTRLVLKASRFPLEGFKWASQRHHKDNSFVLQILRTNPLNLKHLADLSIVDEPIAVDLMKITGMAYRHLAYDIKWLPRVAAEAALQDPLAMADMEDLLKTDDVVETAIERTIRDSAFNNLNISTYLPARWKTKETFLRFLKGGKIFVYLPHWVKEDNDILEALVENCIAPEKGFEESIQFQKWHNPLYLLSKEFVAANLTEVQAWNMVRKNHHVYGLLPEVFKTPAMQLAAIATYPGAIKIVPQTCANCIAALRGNLDTWRIIESPARKDIVTVFKSDSKRRAQFIAFLKAAFMFDPMRFQGSTQRLNDIREIASLRPTCHVHKLSFLPYYVGMKTKRLILSFVGSVMCPAEFEGLALSYRRQQKVAIDCTKDESEDGGGKRARTETVDLTGSESE